MADQQKFRSAIHGYNRTDVTRYIDFLKNTHESQINQLHTDMEEIRAELNLARQLPVRSIKLEAELSASKKLVAELEEKLTAAMTGTSETVVIQDVSADRCAELETQLADTKAALAAAENRAQDAEAAAAAAQQRSVDLESALSAGDPTLAELDAKLADAQQRNNDLDTALSASQLRIADLEALIALNQQRNDELQAQLNAANAACAQLEQDLEAARTAAPVAAVSENLAAQELAAYRRAERAERKARERARDMATQANGVLYDATARIDEDAVEISGMIDQLAEQFDRLRERMIASKSTLKDAVTAMHAIPTEEDDD